MKPIYFDYAATTPVDPRVLEAMLPYFGEFKLKAKSSQLEAGLWGNPGSLHSYGQKASAAIFAARQAIAQTIGAHYSEIIFTASATEANNLALRGALKAFSLKLLAVGGPDSKKLKAKSSQLTAQPRIIISGVEHEGILKTAQDLARGGVDVVIIPVSKEGVVDVKKLKSALNERTVLVSVMMANNEVGTIQPISEIAKIIHDFRVLKAKSLKLEADSYPLLHTDAVQAFNYLKCDVNELGVDLMTLSAQKMYGPKGIGCLYVRSGKKGNFKTYPIEALITGGGQEQGLRSGTENVAGAVGFAKAVELVEAMREKESARLMKLRTACISGIKKTWPGAKLNGSLKERLPNNINIYLPGKSAEEIIVSLDLQGIAVSSGSACTARTPEPSKVLTAMGMNKERATNSLRITLGRPTAEADIAALLAALKKLR